MDCQYTSREYGSSIRTASTPVERSGVLYGLPVHQYRVMEFYTDCQYTASTPVESSGVLYGLTVSTPEESTIWTASTPVESSRVLYMDCQYTSREKGSSIWTASTPVESSRVVY